MKTISTLLFSFLCSFSFSQQANLLFEVDHDFIFADTNGKISIDKRFDRVFEVDQRSGAYIVRTDDYKYGVVKNNAYLFPCEYTQISDLHPTYHFYVYDLDRDTKHALAASDGTLLTDFSYRRIDQYRFDNPLGNKGIDKDGAFFQLYIGAKHHLMYVSKENKSSLLTKEPADEISDWHGTFLLKKDKKQALCEFDKTTKSLKMIHPYANQFFGFNRNEYYLYDAVKDVTKVYSYEHKLLQTLKGANIFEKEDEDVLEIQGPDEASPLEEPERIRSLDRERELLKSNLTGNVFHAFKKPELTYRDLSYPMKYHAKVEIGGKKGNRLAVVHYLLPISSKLRDTSFYVKVDQLIAKDYGTGIIITKKGKLYGAIDSRGNEIFPPQFQGLERLRSGEGADWLVEKNGDGSTLFCYDADKRKVYPVLKGEKEDKFEVNNNAIFVKRPTDENKYQMRLLTTTGAGENKVIVVDQKEFYDSIAPYESFPTLFQTYNGTKSGALTYQANSVIPCIYDSIKVNGYFFPVLSEYDGKPEYEIVQPIFSAYLDGKQHIFHPTKNVFSPEMIHSFRDGSLNASAKISDDGLYVIDTLGNNRVEIYSINGQKLTKEPIVLSYYNRKMASFNKDYWYVRGTDSQNRDVLVGQNGAWFILPARLEKE